MGIKVSKAIETLNHYQLPLKTAEHHDFFDAIKLGIEALKRLEQNRAFIPLDPLELLPGETPEQEAD